ncbi:uncharacterized protein [Arachis hypogaea]|uniref:uncharacterized protein n=1 Tax=Arachis hypogaea TaxID=3818 RepID=UPI000DECD245|nr:uncharacterized protein LOC112708230 [Arachis hypogaea]
MKAPAASSSHHDDYLIPFSSGGVPAATSFSPFYPPHSELMLAPHFSTNGIQNSEPDNFVVPETRMCKGLLRKGPKKTNFWNVNIIDSDGTIKQARLSARKAMKQLNGRKIVLKFNRELQPIGDEAGILSSFLGLLGADYDKFPIYEESWRKIITKDKVYNDLVKENFQFDEDSRGNIKRTILKRIGSCWRNTRRKLYHKYYNSTNTLEQNIERCPSRIDKEHWKLFLAYRNKPDTQEKCRKNAMTRAKQLSMARQKEGMQLKQSDDTHIHEEARTIVEKIVVIEQCDDESQNDSLVQTLGKEPNVSFGLTPIHLLDLNLHPPGERDPIHLFDLNLHPPGAA